MRALLLAQATRVLVQAVGIVVLSRLLTPADFGVAAIVVAVASIAGVLGDFGLSVAAIREPELTREQWSGLFWTNTALGLLIAAGVAGSAPLVAAAVGDSRLTGLLLATAPVFLVNGAGAQYRVQLTRDQRFGTLALLETLAPAVALGAAVALAAIYGGPWPLIAQNVLTSVLLFGLAVTFAPRNPGLPRRNAGIRKMLFLGGAQAVQSVLFAASESIGPLALGHAAPEASVGAFSRAKQLTALPHTNIAAALTRVVVPKLASASRDGTLEAQLGRARAAYGYSVGLIAALVGGLSAPIVAIALGDQWANLTPRLVSIVAISAMLQCVTYVFYWGLLATGKSRILVTLMAPPLAITLVAVVFAAQFGPVAAAWAYVAGAVMRAIPLVVWGSRSLGLQPRRYLRTALPNLAALAIVYAGAFAIARSVSELGALPTVALGLAWAGLIIWVGAAWIPAIRVDVRAAGELALSVARAKRPG